MPAKITKWGFKLWAVCDGISGFMHGFSPYAGKRPGDKVTKDLGGTVVKELCAGLRPGTVIFADNYFSSPLLVQELLAQGKHYVGTVRKGRKHYPKELVDIKATKTTPRGTTNFAVCEKTGVVSLCWLDNKPVHLLASVFSPLCLHTCQRRGRNAAGFNTPQTVPQPGVVKAYNKYMGGVDQIDQLRATYPMERVLRTNIWYKKMYLGLFGIALANGYTLLLFLCGLFRLFFACRFILMKSHVPKTTHEDYQLAVAAGLLQTEEHPLEQVVVAHTSASLRLHKKQPRCSYCVLFVGSSSARRTWNYCRECQVPLCAKGSCFKHYHDEEQLQRIKNSSKQQKEARAKRKRSLAGPGGNKKTKK